MAEQKEPKAKVYRYKNRPKGAKSSEVSSYHPVFKQHIFEDELTEDKVKQLKEVDERYGQEFCNCIKGA